MIQALNGLKVLDLSRFIAGPSCAMQLADFGADVVKVERLAGGDDVRANQPQIGGESLYFLTFNRNKRSFALDFRHPDAPALLRRLATEADILIENFRPGTMERMGCGWEALSNLNPRLIMVRISGFGQDGPLAQRPCFDVIAQAMGGIMDLTGDPDGPPVMAGTFVVDYTTALYATTGALTALQARHATGRGQLVETSLLASAASLLITAIPEQILLGRTMTRQGNRDRYTAPVNNYRASDGAYVYISGGTDALFRRLAEALGRADLQNDGRFATQEGRLENVAAIEAIVERWVGEQPADEVVAAMDKAGVPCARVATVADVVDNPQLRHSDQIIEVEHPTAGAVPTHGVTVRLGATPGAVRRPAPRLGEHTAEIARDWLGMTDAELRRLASEKIVGLGPPAEPT